MSQAEIITDHLGNRYKSVKAMCSAYRIPIKVYENRISNGLTKREALTLPKRKYYRYMNHYFTSKDGLLAYAGLTQSDWWFVEKDVTQI